MNNDRIIMQVEAFEFPTLRTLPYFTSNSQEFRWIKLLRTFPHTIIGTSEFDERQKLMKEVSNTNYLAGCFDYADVLAVVLPKDLEDEEE